MMQSLLEFFGFAFVAIALPALGLLLLAAALWWWLRRWIGKRALDQQPDHIELVPVQANAWREPRRLEGLQQQLDELGFALVGVFRVTPLPEVIIELRLALDHRAVAVLYEDPRADPWMDLWASSPDHHALTVTSSSMVGQLEPMPGRRTISLPGRSVRELLARLEAEVPADVRVLEPGEVARAFEDEWAREMAWRKRRGIGTHEVDAVARRMAEP